MKILSYVLFGTNPFYSKCWPFIIAAREILHPTYAIFISIHTDALSTPAARMALALSKSLPGIEIGTTDQPSPGRKLTLWRNAPIWKRPAYDLVLPRDIDSIPTPPEATCLQDFETTDAPFYTLHHAHWEFPVMGGLSGYRPLQVERFLPPTYEDFVAVSPKLPNAWNWGYHTDETVLWHWFQHALLSMIQYRFGRFNPKNFRGPVIDRNVAQLPQYTPPSHLTEAARILYAVTSRHGPIGKPHPTAVDLGLLLSEPLDCAGPIKTAIAADPVLTEFYPTAERAA